MQGFWTGRAFGGILELRPLDKSLHWSRCKMADGGESGCFAVLTEAQKVDALANKSAKGPTI